MYEDWALVESSFLAQYGIRLRAEDDMSYSEFCSLLSGIMPETPLGKIVGIRAEKDPKTIKNFTKEQKKVRNDWIKRQFDVNRATPEQIKKSIEELQALARSFQ